MQLALPSRDYYLKKNSEAELKAYHRYMTSVAVLLGANPKTAAEEFDDVIKFEKKLANVRVQLKSFIFLLSYTLRDRCAKFQASLPEADRHDTSAIYRKLTLRELQREIPQLQWRAYLQEFISAPITEDEPIVAYAMPYFMQMGRIVRSTHRR